MHHHIFKETVGITTEEKIDFIDDHRDEHSLTILLKVAMLSKSSYFEFKNRKISNQERRKIDISKSIERIWLNSNEIYGARKIKAMLELEGIYVSERTVGNYMKDMNIASVYRRKYKPAKWKGYTKVDTSLYNEIGVVILLLSLNQEDRMLIVMMPKI